jgi:hypothetical protein
MSSLARRSLRTTAATAGIAALGLGFAGQAFAAPAAPELPALPGADGIGDAGLPAAPTTPGLPSQDGFFMPGVANIEMPTVNTAAPELPAGDAFVVPSAPEFAAPESPNADAVPVLPEAPSTEGVDMEFDVDPASGAGSDSTDGFEQNRDSALAAMDMAQSVMELVQGAAADGPSTQDNELG